MGCALAFGISRIVLRLLQPSWTSLLASDLDLPAPLRDALVRLDAAISTLASAGAQQAALLAAAA